MLMPAAMKYSSAVLCKAGRLPLALFGPASVWAPGQQKRRAAPQLVLPASTLLMGFVVCNASWLGRRGLYRAAANYSQQGRGCDAGGGMQECNVRWCMMQLRTHLASPAQCAPEL